MKERKITVEHINNDEDVTREWSLKIQDGSITHCIELTDSEFDSLVRQAATLHISYNRFTTLFRVSL